MGKNLRTVLIIIAVIIASFALAALIIKQEEQNEKKKTIKASKYKYNLEQRVLFTFFNGIGIVVGQNDSNPPSYLIRYMDSDGEIHDVWLYEWEIKANE